MKSVCLLTVALIGLVGSANSVFAEDLNYFRSGTSWEMEVFPDYPESLPIVQIADLISTDNDANGDLKMILSYKETSQVIREIYIKINEEKVYFKFAQNPESDWYLMYDFGLQPGEGDVFYCPYFYSQGSPIYTYLECKEIIADNPQYDGWTTMTMLDRLDAEGNIFEMTGTWIKGLGDVRGVMSNYSQWLDGIDMSLVEVTYDGVVIYSEKPAGIKEVEKNDNMKLTVSGLDLTIKDCSVGTICGIYSVDGRLIKEISAHTGNVNCRLPHKGIFIIRVGSKSYKVLAE